MIKLDVYDSNGKKLKQIEVKEELLKGDIKQALLYDYVKAYNANQRQGNSCTKGRSDVSGSGAKPWRQKGTGRARAGTVKSPIWRGGGIAFGPKPRDYTIRLPKKMKIQALISSVRSSFQEGNLVVIDKIQMDTPKTKKMLDIFSKLKIGENILIGTEELIVNVVKSVNNLKKVQVKEVVNINAYDVLLHDKLLLTEEAVKKLEQKVL